MTCVVPLVYNCPNLSTDSPSSSNGSRRPPIEGLLGRRPKLSPQAAREVKRDTRLRRARTCYGHLAGVAGVYLMEQMRSRGWLEEVTPRPGDRHVRYALTGGGVQALEARSADAVSAALTGQAAYGCLDWTERRQHVGGPLGRVIAGSLGAGGYISLSSGSREVEILRDLQGWLDENEIRR
jgi:hypothetical protein